MNYRKPVLLYVYIRTIFIVGIWCFKTFVSIKFFICERNLNSFQLIFQHASSAFMLWSFLLWTLFFLSFCFIIKHDLEFKLKSSEFRIRIELEFEVDIELEFGFRFEDWVWGRIMAFIYTRIRIRIEIGIGNCAT